MRVLTARSAPAIKTRPSPLHQCTQTHLPTPSPNRMVTRAMRGAHLALRGASFGESTPLGDTTTPLLTRDVLFMRVEWATTQNFLFHSSQSPQHLSGGCLRVKRLEGVWVEPTLMTFPWFGRALCSVEAMQRQRPAPASEPCFLGVNKAGPPRSALRSRIIMRPLARRR